MKRELVVFVLFLLVNVALSVNCFTTIFVDKKTKISTVYETTNKPQSRLFLKIKEIKLDSTEPYIIRFVIEGDEDKCLFLSKEKIGNNYDMSDIVQCKPIADNSFSPSIWMIDYTYNREKSFLYTFLNSKRLIFKPEYSDKIMFITKRDYYTEDLDIFNINPDNKEMHYTAKYSFLSYKEKDELKLNEETRIEYQFNCLLYVKSGITKKPYLLLFRDYELRWFTSINLNWDIEYNEDVAAKTEKNFWSSMYPIAILFDLATLPIQFIAGLIYFLSGGYK